MRSPDEKIKLNSPETGYVDDVTLGATSNDEDVDVEREEYLIMNINTIATYWEKMLFTNGGRLELRKKLDFGIMEMAPRNTNNDDHGRIPCNIISTTIRIDGSSYYCKKGSK